MSLSIKNLNYNKPFTNGLFIAYIENKKSKNLLPILLMYFKGIWTYPDSGKKCKKIPHCWIGPIPTIGKTIDDGFAVGSYGENESFMFFEGPYRNIKECLELDPSIDFGDENTKGYDDPIIVKLKRELRIGNMPKSSIIPKYRWNKELEEWEKIRKTKKKKNQKH